MCLFECIKFLHLECLCLSFLNFAYSEETTNLNRLSIVLLISVLFSACPDATNVTETAGTMAGEDGAEVNFLLASLMLVRWVVKPFLVKKQGAPTNCASWVILVPRLHNANQAFASQKVH